MFKLLLMAGLFLSLLIPQSAFAVSEGHIIRGGDNGTLIMWKSPGKSCYAIDLDNIKAKISTEWTPAFQVLAMGLSPLRKLTVAEKELCSGEPYVAPAGAWAVHDNSPNDPARTTRPGYTLQAGLLIKHKSERVDIGEPCGDQAVASTRNIQYRYTIPRDDKPGRPDGFIGLCVEIK